MVEIPRVVFRFDQATTLLCATFFRVQTLRIIYFLCYYLTICVFNYLLYNFIFKLFRNTFPSQTCSVIVVAIRKQMHGQTLTTRHVAEDDRDLTVT